MDNLDRARLRVLNDPRGWELFIASASLPFPDDTPEIVKARLWAAWGAEDELNHALERADSPEEIANLIAAEKQDWETLIEENERRECAEMRIEYA